MLIAGRDIEGIGPGTAQSAFWDGTLEDSVATLRAALDAEATLIGTALAYTHPAVESMAGRQGVTRHSRQAWRRHSR